ncbi:MAG: TIGR02444 family protein [Rhodospirillales bacterium]|nr:TIGR02444 family protein [Rhodospirillales bacterium]MDH3919400.1 TIGR02444 family protein [Rhodospirillales bacterium]MDH3966913.1 TIGR02444 family protein [Rhodospirillales bacterium]
MTVAPDTSFWDYSLAVYARPAVAEACLALQDRRGLDVNLLLFCCWAGDRGQGLATDDIAGLVDAVGAWHEQVVVALRGARRWLKTQDTAPSEPAETLRRAIKAEELEAERLEQLILAGMVPVVEGQGDPALAAANLGAYFAVLDLAPGDEDRADLAALLCGLFDGLRMDDALTLFG